MNAKPITFRGRTQSITAWAQELGIKHPALRWRLNQGWPIDRVMSVGIEHRGRPRDEDEHSIETLTVDGVKQSITEWALDYGIPASLIETRLNDGWSDALAVTAPMPTKQGDKLPADYAHAEPMQHMKPRSCGTVAAPDPRWGENIGEDRLTGVLSTARETTKIEFSQ